MKGTGCTPNLTGCSNTSVPIPSPFRLCLCAQSCDSLALLFSPGPILGQETNPGTNFLSLQNLNQSALPRITGSFHEAQRCGSWLCIVVLQVRADTCCGVSSSLRYFSNSWSSVHEWGQFGIYQSPFHRCFLHSLAHLWEGSSGTLYWCLAFSQTQGEKQNENGISHLI